MSACRAGSRGQIDAWDPPFSPIRARDHKEEEEWGLLYGIVGVEGDSSTHDGSRPSTAPSRKSLCMTRRDNERRELMSCWLHKQGVQSAGTTTHAWRRMKTHQMSSWCGNSKVTLQQGMARWVLELSQVP